MANKRPKPEEIVTKLRQVELLPRGERPLYNTDCNRSILNDKWRSAKGEHVAAPAKVSPMLRPSRTSLMASKQTCGGAALDFGRSSLLRGGANCRIQPGAAIARRSAFAQ